MSLRKKTLIITGSLIALLVFILYTITNIIIMSDYREAEKQVAVKNAGIMLNMFNDNLSALSITTADWSAWDDTYDFVVEHNEDYIDLNLSDENFTGLNVNLMLIANSSGDIIFSKCFDLENNVEAPVPETLLKHISADDPLISNTEPSDNVSGVLLSNEGPLLIVSRPIIQSNFNGPAKGSFIMGRFINAESIEHLSNNLGLSVQILPANDNQAPPDFQTALANMTGGNPYYVKPLNGETIAAYTLINDIYGNPGVIAKVETPREIYKIGSLSIRYFIFSFLIVGLIIGGINLLLLEKAVLSRLLKLIGSVKKVGMENDLSKRLTVDGKDELSHLAAEINATLSSLEQYHQKLQDTEEAHRIDLARQVLERTGELRTANEQLQEERKRLYYLLENLPFIVSLITPDFSLVYANRYFKEHFGEPEGKACYRLYWGRTAPCEECPAVNVIDNNVMSKWEYTIQDGRTYQIYYYPFHDMDGSLLVLELGIDVTEQKQMEKEIAHLERLNLVGEMAAGIGHEIRNPMTAVRGLLQILSKKEYNEKHKKYYSIMIEELDRANSIITEFLSLARNRPVQFKEQNLNQIINTILPLISADATITYKSVETDFNDIPDLPLDEKEIRQLLLNLVRNGLEETPFGGKIIIKTFEQNGEVFLSISDQGKGIDPDILKKIGTPFFTTKENGTGLGLAVCFSIAARHNAVVDIQTGPAGTTFHVRFKRP